MYPPHSIHRKLKPNRELARLILVKLPSQNSIPFVLGQLPDVVAAIIFDDQFHPLHTVPSLQYMRARVASRYQEDRHQQ
jgi:hypothetical protein